MLLSVAFLGLDSLSVGTVSESDVGIRWQRIVTVLYLKSYTASKVNFSIKVQMSACMIQSKNGPRYQNAVITQSVSRL